MGLQNQLRWQQGATNMMPVVAGEEVQLEQNMGSTSLREQNVAAHNLEMPPEGGPFYHETPQQPMQALQPLSPQVQSLRSG